MAAARRIFDRACSVKRCIFATPFAREFKPAWPVVEKSVEEAGWRVVRGGQIPLPRGIMDAIIEGIQTCDLVITDSSRNNPNVFCEIGYAHAIGRDVIVLRQKGQKPLPFDIASIRTVFYTLTNAGLGKLRRELRKLLVGEH